ncbi:hypothetical protein ACFE04_002987 [Oxalis oulophora]
MAMMQWCGAIARRVMTSTTTTTGTSSRAMSTMMTSSSSSGNVVCGRGDKKTKKGKRFKGSFGKLRPKRDKMIERIKDKNELPSLNLVSIAHGSIDSVNVVIDTEPHQQSTKKTASAQVEDEESSKFTRKSEGSLTRKSPTCWFK